MLPGDLLTEYADKFFGFGTWHAKIWFIGIEESGGWAEQDVQRRLDVWKQNGKCELEDAPTFYPACGNRKWHGNGARLQETWTQLVRMLLLSRGIADTDEAILDYQRNHLGRNDGETCVAELLPLPSPSIKEWRYSNWSELHWLSSRDCYYAHLLVARAADLARRVKVMSPSAVIFYGSSFFQTWRFVAGATRVEAIPKKLVGFTAGPTAFFVTKHPSALPPGNTRNDYFREIGEYLQRAHGKQFGAVTELSNPHEQPMIKATAPAMPARLDWPSAIGNFILNYGVLDWHVFVFLEKRMPPEQFAKIKNGHFKDRIARVETLVKNGNFSAEQKREFAKFFQRLDPVRELRNHIAHGHLQVLVTDDGKTPGVALTLPKNLDAADPLESRNLEFQELINALSELPNLIEEFQKLSGDWSEENEIGVNS